MTLDIYDFDGTLYDGDSTVDFWRFCVRRQPSLLVYLPVQLWGVFGMKLHLLPPEKGKSLFFAFLRRLRQPDTCVTAFWAAHRDRLAGWFAPLPEATTVVISASPAFLVRAVCEQAGAQEVLATDMDSATGRIRGRNCKGAEKVRRLHERFGEAVTVRSMYTDSVRADAPLLALAQRRFLVKHGRVTEWEEQG